MNSLRNVLGFLMVMMLATFAGSSIAASKSFYAEVDADIASAATTVTMTFYNNSPNPSTINSIRIVPPNGLLTITNVSPGTPSLQADGSVIVNAIPGIKKGGQLAFTISVTINVTGCNVGTWGAFANAGNAYPQGDEFDPALSKMKMSSGIGCAFAGTVNCGGSFDASVGGAGPNDPGYANVTVGTTLKTGAPCTGPMGYGAVNSLLTDNKLVVVLSDPNAAFIATINSVALPLDADGYASLRVKVAWEQDTFGNWIYINAPTCLCSSALSSCMPIDTVSTDPYFNQPVKVCAADYTWVVAGPGLARYFATVIGTGNDPAMGWQ